MPLGDVAGHATRRFTACYGVLCQSRMLVLLERVPLGASLRAAGASDQDKQVSGDFQAAHAIPRELRVSAPGTAADGAPLYELLRNMLNQTWVRREIFARTDPYPRGE